MFDFKDLNERRLRNDLYLLSYRIVAFIIDLLPPPIRSWVYALVIHGTARRLHVDYGVYFKYPWLVEIGDDVSINRGAEFYPSYHGRSKIIIGNNVRIAPNVKIHAAGHDVNSDSLYDTGSPVEIADHVWIGASAVILQGVKIGPNSIVAAGSLVNKDVPANVIVGGVPAVVLRHRDQEA